MAEALLTVDDLHAGYGSGWIVRGARIEVRAGELVAIFAPNGSGKTTLLNAVLGLVQRCRGRVLLDGTDLAALPTHLRARRGLRLVPEGRHLFTQQSVRSNLLLGAAGLQRRGKLEELDRTLGILPLLEPLLGRQAGTLSGGEQQAVAIGRALMGRPRVLLLDEFSWGLAPAIVDKLLAAFAPLTDCGIGILATDQYAQQLARVADRGYVVRHGQTIGVDLKDGTLDDAQALLGYA